MKKIENKNNRYRFAIFSKRRAGLYKKASELAIECDVDIGIIMLSPAGNPHSFFHPNVDAIVSRFQNPDMQLSQIDCLVAAYNRNEVKKLQNELEELDIKKDIAIARTKHLDKMAETRQKSWWESIEQLSADEVTDFEAWLNATSSKMRQHLNQLENGASTSLG
ncbi:hypothetical protein P3S68_014072 [Capsicum galapagoense]